MPHFQKLCAIINSFTYNIFNTEAHILFFSFLQRFTTFLFLLSLKVIICLSYIFIYIMVYYKLQTGANSKKNNKYQYRFVYPSYILVLKVVQCFRISS